MPNEEFKKQQKVNFLFLPEHSSTYEKSHFIVLPVPYEATTTFVKGTKKAPSAIISASNGIETFDEETAIEFVEVGITTLKEIESQEEKPEQMVGKICDIYSSILNDGKFIVMLGGEHSISLGAIRALKNIYSAFSVLQLDAHGDLRESYDGTPYSHACVMRRVMEETECPVVQVGIRSFSNEENEFIRKKKLKLFTIDHIRKNQKWIDEIICCLTDKIYITIDLDCLDPSIMPAVGTPEPNGLTYPECLNLLKLLSEKKEIIGFDAVELCPIAGLVYPDITAARIIAKMIAYIIKNRKLQIANRK